MKSTKRSILLTSFILLLSILSVEVAEAQIESWVKSKVERARRKVRQKADDEVNREIDRQVDDAYDKTRESMKDDGESTTDDDEIQEETPDGESSADMFSALLDMKEVNVDKNYTFSSAYKYDIEFTEDGKTQNLGMDMLMPDGMNPQYVGMKTQMNGYEGTTIIDHDIDAMLTLAGGQGVYMSFDAITEASQSVDNDAPKEVTIEPSGKTDVHLGIPIREYIYTSPDENGRIWISTNDEGSDVYKLFMEMGKTFGGNAPTINMHEFAELGGMHIKSYMTMSDGSTVNMILKEIDKTSSNFDASSTSFMDMSSMSKMGMYGR